MDRHEDTASEANSYLESLRDRCDPRVFCTSREDALDFFDTMRVMRVSRRALRRVGPVAGIDPSQEKVDMGRLVQWYCGQIGSIVQDFLLTELHVDYHNIPVGCLPTLDVNAHAVWSQNSAVWQVLVQKGLTGQSRAADSACPAAF